MTKIGLIRHGKTEWNITGLVQGSTDIPLSDYGINEVSDWSLPSDFVNFNWLASPLKRAYQTAHILAGFKPRLDPRAVEMAWGDWEGRSLTDLRSELGDLMVAWEAKGLDFRGPNGESPREVQNRMKPLLKEIAEEEIPTIIVTHKGFIRALYALSVGWDMVEKPDEKLNDGCIHLFELNDTGDPSIVNLNINLKVEK
ncbi:MAG: histidine phosphatase family protein [Rhodospirillales bacterium]|nr:histidine phosphatase family protein [Rhodospirillales bacterium]